MDSRTAIKLVIAVVALLFLILIELWGVSIKLRRIDARMRKRFPTEKESDSDFAVRDPMGHWSAHKDDKK
jgi:hypothetical protein